MSVTDSKDTKSGLPVVLQADTRQECATEKEKL